MAKTGRPSKYTQAVALEICNRIAQGESLIQICRNSEHLPDKCTVVRWLQDPKHEEFRTQYAQARESQMEHYADEILEIADDGQNDWMERESKNGEVFEVENHEVLNRSRLRVDARKWLMSKLAPKKYGDVQKLEHSGPGGEPLQAVMQIIKK